MSNYYVPYDLAKNYSSNINVGKYELSGNLNFPNTPLGTPSYQSGKPVSITMEPRNTLSQIDTCPFNDDCQSNSTYTYLNKRGVPPSPYFQSFPGEFLKKEYRSRKPDGRLVDAARGYTSPLDSIPTQVVYDLIHDNVSGNKDLDNYGTGYKTYNTVSGGEIRYYIDKEIADPFINPVYAFPSESIAVEWVDPMSNRKTQYIKQYPAKNMGCLSWIDDSCKQRDDITSLQQNVYNTTRFDLAYNRIN